MSASNDFETAILALILCNTNIANLGDATGVRGSSTAGSVYVALHTADPGESGTQSTSEASYTGYARVAVARSTAGWTVASGAFQNAAAINFPTCTAGTNTLTHFSIGTSSSGAGMILLSGAFSSPSSLSVSAGITPSFPAGTVTGTAD